MNIQLDLNEGDGAGSRVPGGNEIIDNSGKNSPSKQKRNDYINKLQEDLDEKLKERYAYANQ